MGLLGSPAASGRACTSRRTPVRSDLPDIQGISPRQTEIEDTAKARDTAGLAPTCSEVTRLLMAEPFCLPRADVGSGQGEPSDAVVEYSL
jgi:hypothetical protein